MNILGVELEIDFLDADQVEMYESELYKLQKDIGNETQYEGKSTADAFRIQCRIIDRFFDTVFGEGTAKKLFHGKSNLRDHMEAFGMVVEASKIVKDEIKSIVDRYDPNRAQKRQMEKNNRQIQKQGSRNYNHNAAGHKGRYQTH